MAGGIVTVVGSNGGHVVPVTVNGSQAFSLAKAYQAVVQGAFDSGKYFGASVGVGGVAPAPTAGDLNQIVATAGGAYTYASGYDHFVTDTTSKVFIDNSAATAGTTLSTLVGTGGAYYIAGAESGTFIAGGGNNSFANSGAGAYTVATSDGNDTISAGSGNTSISAGTGFNTITLGAGVDTVTSEGTDFIRLGSGFDRVSLSGSNSTVYGGSGTAYLDGSSGSKTTYNTTGASTVFGGDGDTVNASAAATIYGAAKGSTTVNEIGTSNLSFVAGAGSQSTVNAGSGTALIFGANNADVNFTGGNSKTTVVAGAGNQTLNGGNSTSGVALFVANNAGTGNIASIAGGTGADTLVAGLGEQTLTGGSGAANLFVIAENGTMSSAQITISDFGSAAGNLVSLYGYGGNQVQDLLNSAKVVGGSTVVQLSDKSTITFTNVTHLDVSQFKG